MKQPRGKRVSIDRENGWLYALQPLDQTRISGRRNCNVNLDDRAGIVQT